MKIEKLAIEELESLESTGCYEFICIDPKFGGIPPYYCMLIC